MVQDDSTVQIQGLVIACEWSENGRPKRLKVSAAGETDYFLENTPNALPLYEYLNEMVTIFGKVRRVRNHTYIDIDGFTPSVKNEVI